MVKKTRDDAIYVTGLATDVVLDQIHETFSSVGTIKVRPIFCPPSLLPPVNLSPVLPGGPKDRLQDDQHVQGQKWSLQGVQQLISHHC